jgi:glutathione S-transferase
MSTAMTAAPILFIGNKNYSSWSLRPWLALRWAGIAFEERLIVLGGEGYGRSRIPAVRAVSPSGKVPALQQGDLVIHDSLAICEWAAEQARDLWPRDPTVRARARAATCEMHAGFAAVRRDLSMNIRRRLETAPPWPQDTQDDLDRLIDLFETALTTHGGPWLFGQRSIADAFYTPVAARLRTYGVALPPAAQAYVAHLLADADFRAWEADAVLEPWAVAQTDALYQ